MILCRMEDAARELTASAGASTAPGGWPPMPWSGVEREGQRILLRLTDGRRVPVGRSFRPISRKQAGSDRADVHICATNITQVCTWSGMLPQIRSW
jgi:hypothetical protein